MNNLPKPRLSFASIINMNVGFFGIQYSFGLQQSAVNPIYDMLGASPDEIPILNLAGPVTGLLIQPIIGALSDKTWSTKWGRRKPYFFIGAIMCSLALLAYPFSSALWMAAGLLWILDAGNNTAMEPYRAFIADTLNSDQQPTGFQAQSFFTGFGQTLANISLFIFPMIFIGKTGSLPNWVYASFFIGAVFSIGSIWWSMRTTKEIPPTEEELRKMKSEPLNLVSPFTDVFSAIVDMPKVMWQLALVYLFQWYALFCYWQNSSKSVALSVWNATPASDPGLYEKAVSWTGLVNGWYNIVTFLSAFALVYFAKRIGPKYVHFLCLVLAGVGFLFFPNIHNQNLLFVAITGFGIGWASMMGIPYLMVVSQIPKERYGVYMGLINMMIVIPMILQTLSFGAILKNFLGNDPRNAITFAGTLLLLAALATLLIKTTKVSDDEVMLQGSGH
ncbi:MAG: MFS transporter [Cytophagaceae bacterium]|nr:MFS transporter [Cytophagaceae bacterium]MBL0301042.1 MFS transporter [Cytophagaceae bacterium]